ncbi:4-coumarate ligase [Fusarium sp. NRRL 52700]|nr:4-coumarate ligase [Fusarium sp. NRRL 52700]
MASVILSIMRRMPFSSCVGAFTSVSFSRPLIPRLTPAISYSTAAQTVSSHLREYVPWTTRVPGLAIVQGTNNPPLWNRNLGSLVKEQAEQRGERTALIVPWQKARLTFKDLEYRSSIAAKDLLHAGLKQSDAVGIFAGNRFEYIELFLASARIGCPFVVFNTTNSPHELCSAVACSDCKALFIASSIESVKTDDHVYQVATRAELGACLEHLIMLDRSASWELFNCHRYEDFLNDSIRGSVTNQFVRYTMSLTQNDLVCCPPPLFHYFGLVMEFLASFTHGSSIVFPSDRFNARQTLDAVEAGKATALLDVPTIFISRLEQMESQPRGITTMRTGLVAGSPVSPSLMDELRAKINVQGMLIAYGMTETSPVTFITSLDNPDDRMLTSLGRVLPHTAAKIVDTKGNTVPIGERGEICTSGFALQKGYYKD